MDIINYTTSLRMEQSEMKQSQGLGLLRFARNDCKYFSPTTYCDGFPASDRDRALNTLRYIHANPKAAKMRHGFFYDFSNYGSYERLTDDGLTQWHPAFLRLGNSLEECAKKYKGFC